MTHEEIQAIFDRYLGKPVEAEDPSNLDQCFDWAFKYCDEIGVDRAAIRHLRAYEIYTLPNDLTLKYFFYTPNTPNGIPPIGAILVFSNGVGPSGHVSVVKSADTNQITSTDQNWNGHSYVEYINHPYDNVLGWLVPKFDSLIISQKDVDQVRADRDTNWNLYQDEIKKLGDLQKEFDDFKNSHSSTIVVPVETNTVPVETGTTAPSLPTPSPIQETAPVQPIVTPQKSIFQIIWDWFRKSTG